MCTFAGQMAGLMTQSIVKCCVGWEPCSMVISEHCASHIRLMPLMQNAYFNASSDLEAVAQRSTKSTLAAFYKTNCTDAFARTLLYHDFPTHYRYHKTAGKWTRRAANSKPAIGRMYLSTPKDGERYFLRVLLCHVLGPRSQGGGNVLQIMRAYNQSILSAGIVMLTCSAVWQFLGFIAQFVQGF